MKIDVLPNSDVVAREAVKFIAAEARAAVLARGRFSFAVSGGRTPWIILQEIRYELSSSAGSRSHSRPYSRV